jgi:hypothetical protein
MVETAFQEKIVLGSKVEPCFFCEKVYRGLLPYFLWDFRVHQGLHVEVCWWCLKKRRRVAVRRYFQKYGVLPWER